MGKGTMSYAVWPFETVSGFISIQGIHFFYKPKLKAIFIAFILSDISLMRWVLWMLCIKILKCLYSLTK